MSSHGVPREGLTGQAAGDEPRPVRVLYLCGSQRSGTHILSWILAGLEGVGVAGEVKRLWVRAARGPHGCTCGKSIGDCEVWSHVVSADGAFDGLDAPSIVRLRDAALPPGRSWRTTRRLLASDVPLDPSTPQGRYGRLLADFYRAYASASGSSVVIDSSKDPGQAALLRRVPGVSMVPVQVVRDPRAVLDSHRRRRSSRNRPSVRDATRVAATWTAIQLACESIRRARGSHGFLIRYEDWVVRPREALAPLCVALGGKPEDLPVDDRGVASLPPVHPHGRRRRYMQGTMELTPDERWKRELDAADRAVVASMTLPLLLRYGYPVRVRS
ncbi:MAG TPA: hypothetical protein VG709_06165 [Actinomycetota bacterium]|nr:hypothetical protein [Actinomycetota bacterium]